MAASAKVPDLDASQVDRLEVHTRLCVPQSGAYRMGASGLGSVTLTVDDRTVLDDTITLPPGVDVVEGIMKPPQRHMALDLDADQDVEVLLTYRPTGGAALGGSEVTMLTVQLNVAPQYDERAGSTAQCNLPARRTSPPSSSAPPRSGERGL